MDRRDHVERLKQQNQAQDERSSMGKPRNYRRCFQEGAQSAVEGSDRLGEGATSSRMAKEAGEEAGGSDQRISMGTECGHQGYPKVDSRLASLGKSTSKD